MGGLITTFKRFFTNKTTVTIVGIIVGIAVLVGFYTYRVNNAVNPKKVPVATKDISATEEITQDDIEMVEISNSFLKNADVITNVNDLVGKYVSTGTSIPKGGMFYTTQIVEKEELPNSIFDEIPDGYTIYQLKVNNVSTFANSIYPGDKIDLYMDTKQNGLVVFNKFISGIEVLAVRDSSGQNVFDVTSGRTPAWLLFAVPTDMYRYLKIAEFISGINITPVPRNKLYNTESGSTEISNDQLLQIITDKTMDMGADYSNGGNNE